MEWISVKDRTPDNKLPIRVLIDGLEHTAYWEKDIDGYRVGCGESCYYCGGYTSLSFGDDNYRKKPTHWMPLPEKPNE